MIVNTCSATMLALFIEFLCALSNGSIESKAMTTEEVTSSAPAVTTGATLAEVKNEDSATALKKLSRTRQSPIQKKTAAIHCKKTVTVTTAGVLLTAVVGMLMASGKLRQRLHATLNKAGGEIERNTMRRLAEGGGDGGKCVSLAITSESR
ncbi:Toxoplasma gondii family B protein [Toxoplasma gondii RUB]|uniref:Toxoplasma gondii family B protein n=1 Tax=Toxoplasma gondii RUB TaxID=935652 RepID=A0A086LJ65_TOXGO|nr:Toxoplasma gondii family B protein [Toxoplasma gondii RUB]